VTAVVDANARGEAADEPFSFLAASSSAEAQLRCARTYVEDWFPACVPPLWQGRTYGHDRIRVAYLSADFGDHPTSYLMAGVLEQHDRRRFETIGLSLQPGGTGHYAERVRAAFDRFLEVGTQSDEAIARGIRDMEIDILVDLMGHTRGTRLGILARRPAPVQVSYLGYPGTTAAPYVDYLIADEFVIPGSQRPCYSESIVYLPHCFQANDHRRALPQAPTRAQAGLPENGFVFCAFNATYKLTPDLFDLWCRLLRSVAGSVLWLLADRESTKLNLEREAHAREVAAGRLIFATRLDYERHLARLRLADLFLDTSPFNAGATASDALWAGVPVLTCPGEALSSRMAGSLLRAVGLTELIADSLKDYERRACELAGNPATLSSVKARLWDNRTSMPLFDTPRFCGHLERAYMAMFERAQRGERPVDIAIEANRTPKGDSIG
jgi:predicted O-linked N-acetylglucosamine transferase (SPINDLY family)